MPSYYRLTSIISKAIQKHENHLHSVIKESLNNAQKDLLDSLLSNETGNDSEPSGGSINLTSLKQPFHSLKAAHLKANLNDWQFLQSIYQNVSPVINKLELSPEAIRFYAYIVLKTKAFYLTRRRAESRYLHLLAFVAHQSFRFQDMPVRFLNVDGKKPTRSFSMLYAIFKTRKAISTNALRRSFSQATKRN